MKILFIDNFDSFTYNLVEEFSKLDANVLVYRSSISMETLDKVINDFSPNLIVLGPGPSGPEDAGICIDLVKKYYEDIPMLGICLGHQVLAVAFDGKVDRCHEVFHGKPSMIQHIGTGTFDGVDNPFQVGRYHSLCVEEMPEDFKVTAAYNDIVMAMQHKKHPLFGLQFHPESILTPYGGLLIKNILDEIK